MSFEMDGAKVSLSQLRHQTVYFEVCVSEEHLHIFVTGDKGDFRNRQPHLKEPADGYICLDQSIWVIQGLNKICDLFFVYCSKVRVKAWCRWA